MSRVPLVAICGFLCLQIASAYAADQSCTAQAAEKKLAGAAKTANASATRKPPATLAAVEKKLAGAAKTSFTQKCVKDAVGS